MKLALPVFAFILWATIHGLAFAQSLVTAPDLDAAPVVAANESRWDDAIETDRDSFTPATTTAGKGRLITESAYSFVDNRIVPETHSFPELLFRYGLNEIIELRLGWNYEVGGASNTTSGTDLIEDIEDGSIERESNLHYGIKLKATQQQGWRPESAMILQGFIPTSGAGSSTQLALTYVFSWEFFDDWKWDSAIRYGTGAEAEGDNFRLWAPSTVLKIPVGERWNVHAEYFGVFSQGHANDITRHYFSCGMTTASQFECDRRALLRAGPAHRRSPPRNDQGEKGESGRGSC